MKLPLVFASICFALAAGCTGPSAPEPSAESPTPATDAEIEEAREAMSIEGYEPKKRMQPGLEEPSEKAKADLARRLDVDPESIDVVQAESVTWRNSGLGCPDPDMRYMDVLTPGVLIRLRSGGKVYEYHGAQRSEPFLCEPAERIEEPAPGGGYDDST